MLELYCMPFKYVFRAIPRFSSLRAMITQERVWLGLYDHGNMSHKDKDNDAYLGWNISYFDGGVHRLRWLDLAGEVYFRVDEECRKYQMLYSQELLSGDTCQDSYYSYPYDKNDTDGFGYYYDRDDIFTDILDGCGCLKWRDLDDDKVLLTPDGALLIPSTDGEDIYMALMFLPRYEAILRYLIQYGRTFFRVAMFDDGKLIKIRNIGKNEDPFDRLYFRSEDHLKAYRDVKRGRFYF